MSGWELIGSAPLTMHRTNRLADMYVLSPFVWREGETFHLLVRAVPRRDDEPRLKMAEIWYGSSKDGFHFDMAEAPTIWPGPDLLDLDGCEDPTVHCEGEMLRVWYTGYNQNQETGRLLMARGPDPKRLAKTGLTIDSTPDFSNPKEATVASTGQGNWRMFFEYARGGASLIGQCDTDDLDGPWKRTKQSFLRPRPKKWDNWHLSPGPVVGERGLNPGMFYNGATQDAKWRIGWATFDSRLNKLIDRCEKPLIVPIGSNDGGSSDIAFAASAIEVGDEVMLYYSQSDQDLRCAQLRRG